MSLKLVIRLSLMVGLCGCRHDDGKLLAKYQEAIRHCVALQAELEEVKRELETLRPPKQIKIVPDPLVGQPAPSYHVAGWINGEPARSRVVVLDLWVYT